jgi:GMP reductase
METVIDNDLYRKLTKAGVFCVMHRFHNNLPQIKLIEESREEDIVSISVGVNQDSVDFLKTMVAKKQHIDYITIDVAHGHHSKVKEAVRNIRKIYPEAFIIAGNVTTPEAVRDLESWGADAVKVGIGPGLACTTRLQTGFHIPMFTAVSNCAEVAKVPIIADGGVKYYGDIAKALVAGATMVMCGSLFANCTDSPAPIVNGRKIYFGSASFEAKKESRHVEGMMLELEPSITSLARIEDMRQALQSSISYAGGTNLACFSNVHYVINN